MPADAFRLDSDGILRCNGFQQFDWQRHGFGTKDASPHADVTLRQVHSSTVRNAAGLSDRQSDGDALISNQNGLAIGIRTADCVPLLLLDCRNRAVAAVHAGWRGSAANIVNQALSAMHDSFGSDPKDVYAAIGPCIRACCYEVGLDVAQQFSAQFPEWPPLQGRAKLDLAEANRRQLRAGGVASESIFDSRLCTACAPDLLFSYRREPDNPGRMVAAIARLR